MNRNAILYLLEIDCFYLIQLMRMCNTLPPDIMNIAKMEIIYIDGENC